MSSAHVTLQPSTPPTHAAENDAIRQHALGFLVRNHGTWSEGSLARFRNFLHLRGLAIRDDALLKILHKAKLEYCLGTSRLYVCGAEPCATAPAFEGSEPELRELAERTGVPVSRTGCQGRCKQAPVLALRVGNRSQIFGRMTNAEDWRAVGDFVQTAARAGSFLVPSSGAEEFRYDPVHHHHRPSGHLRSLRFLVGRFHGQGRFANDGSVFEKEVVGRYEVDGNFLALRMAASYPLPDGGEDVHKALVIVGSELCSGTIVGRAYTDGGTVRDYVVERRESALQFEDESPDHARTWKRARKTLTPTSAGYEELFEVDDGTGFTPYYNVNLRSF